jgi:hypothetical protein
VDARISSSWHAKMIIMFSTADFQPPKNRLMIWLMYS